MTLYHPFIMHSFIFSPHNINSFFKQNLTKFVMQYLKCSSVTTYGNIANELKLCFNLFLEKKYDSNFVMDRGSNSPDQV